jgi:hypothetical protein
MDRFATLLSEDTWIHDLAANRAKAHQNASAPVIKVGTTASLRHSLILLPRTQTPGMFCDLITGFRSPLCNKLGPRNLQYSRGSGERIPRLQNDLNSA